MRRRAFPMLPELFKSEDRVRILRYTSERKSVSVRSVATGTGVSSPVVSRYLSVLIHQGLCEREGRTISWVSSPVSTELKRFMNFFLVDEHLPSLECAKGIGLYGSWARGTNTYESDLDLWILLDEYDQELELTIAEFQHALSQKIGYDVHTFILTKKKIRDLPSRDPPFYREFIKDHWVIRGEGIDIA